LVLLFQSCIFQPLLFFWYSIFESCILAICTSWSHLSRFRHWWYHFKLAAVFYLRSGAIRRRRCWAVFVSQLDIMCATRQCARSTAVRHVPITSWQCGCSAQFADNVQLYMAIWTSDDFSASLDVSTRRRLLVRGLLFNPAKTQTVLFDKIWHWGPAPQGYNSKWHRYCRDSIVPLRDTVNLLGVTLDSVLTMDRHVTKVIRSCSCHMCTRHTRPLLTLDVAKMVGQYHVIAWTTPTHCLLSYCTSEQLIVLCFSVTNG